MLIDTLISALIANDDGSHRCFLKSRRECFYPVVLMANKNNFGDVTLNRNSRAVTPENLSYSLCNQQNGVFYGELQSTASPQIKHQ